LRQENSQRGADRAATDDRNVIEFAIRHRRNTLRLVPI
jgi:hypothetical protein